MIRIDYEFEELPLARNDKGESAFLTFGTAEISAPWGEPYNFSVDAIVDNGVRLTRGPLFDLIEASLFRCDDYIIERLIAEKRAMRDDAMEYFAELRREEAMLGQF